MTVRFQGAQASYRMCVYPRYIRIDKVMRAQYQGTQPLMSQVCIYPRYIIIDKVTRAQHQGTQPLLSHACVYIHDKLLIVCAFTLGGSDRGEKRMVRQEQHQQMVGHRFVSAPRQRGVAPSKH